MRTHLLSSIETGLRFLNKSISGKNFLPVRAGFPISYSCGPNTSTLKGNPNDSYRTHIPNRRPNRSASCDSERAMRINPGWIASGKSDCPSSGIWHCIESSARRERAFRTGLSTRPRIGFGISALSTKLKYRACWVIYLSKASSLTSCSNKKSGELALTALWVSFGFRIDPASSFDANLLMKGNQGFVGAPTTIVLAFKDAVNCWLRCADFRGKPSFTPTSFGPDFLQKCSDVFIHAYTIYANG